MHQCERVLHVLYSMNCAGAENFLMNMYRNIDREGLQFDFLLNFQGQSFFEKEIRQLGGRIYKMQSVRQLGPIRYKKALESFFRTNKEHRLIHSHLESTSGLILKAAKNAGKPLRIAHAHNTSHTGNGISDWPENAFKNYCKSKISASATAYFACSKKAADFLFEEKAAHSQIIKNAIDGEKHKFSQTLRKKTRSDFGLESNTTVLGHVGRFYDQKNHGFLLKVFKSYLELEPDSLLWLVGEGELLEKTKLKAEKLGLADKVLFMGLRKDVASLMQAMDVFLLPSKFEGLALVLIEAQAAGLPCLASNTITSEADLGQGYIEFLPIGKGREKLWAEKIFQSDFSQERKGADLTACGYDAFENAKKLEDLYHGMLNDLG